MTFRLWFLAVRWALLIEMNSLNIIKHLQLHLINFIDVLVLCPECPFNTACFVPPSFYKTSIWFPPSCEHFTLHIALLHPADTPSRNKLPQSFRNTTLCSYHPILGEFQTFSHNKGVERLGDITVLWIIRYIRHSQILPSPTHRLIKGEHHHVWPQMLISANHASKQIATYISLGCRKTRVTIFFILRISLVLGNSTQIAPDSTNFFLSCLDAEVM